MKQVRNDVLKLRIDRIQTEKGRYAEREIEILL